MGWTAAMRSSQRVVASTSSKRARGESSPARSPIGPFSPPNTPAGPGEVPDGIWRADALLCRLSGDRPAAKEGTDELRPEPVQADHPPAVGGRGRGVARLGPDLGAV